MTLFSHLGGDTCAGRSFGGRSSLGRLPGFFGPLTPRRRPLCGSVTRSPPRFSVGSDRAGGWFLRHAPLSDFGHFERSL